MSLQINEFSRELIDISQKNDKYVSGGFGSEVGRFNHPVPEKIKDAVNRGDFRINDNYPPEKEQEYALIARELDEYSVLAVASGAIDDKSRPLVVYRYFWLSKPEENIDGIGVLLKWWLNAGKPKFEFVENPNSNELSYSVRELSVNFESKNCEQLNPQLVENLADIKYYPFPFIANQSIEFTSSQLHSLALHLQKQSNTPLAWAWNVRRLEYPERFDLIYCVDEIYPCIVNNIHQREKSLKATPNDKPSAQPIPQKVQPDEKTYSEIKQCLLDIANTDGFQRQPYLNKLTQYTEKFPINQWNWKRLIEEEMTEKPYNLAKVRYIALLVIFGQKPIHEWLYWLRSQINDNYQLYSFYLQMQIIERISASNDRVQYIKAGIVNLLLECKSASLKLEHYQEIEWLLIQSNSIWKDHFESYASELLKQLIRRDHGNDEFCQKVLENLKNRDYHQRNNFKHHFSEYTRLARLFCYKHNYALSALFYQLSHGKVPSEIFERDYVQIIPTIQEEKSHIQNEVRQDVRRQRFSIFIFFKSHIEIIVLVTVMILGLSAITYIFVRETFPQLLEQNSQ